MKDCERGRIRNRKFAQQIRDFSGLRYGNITPTDIDCMLEFGNTAFILVELKYAHLDCDATLQTGQRLAIERLVDALQDAGKHSVGIVARHTSQDDIDVANCVVVTVRYNKRWQNDMYPSGYTVVNVVDSFVDEFAPKYSVDRQNKSSSHTENEVWNGRIEF